MTSAPRETVRRLWKGLGFGKAGEKGNFWRGPQDVLRGGGYGFKYRGPRDEDTNRIKDGRKRLGPFWSLMMIVFLVELRSSTGQRERERDLYKRNIRREQERTLLYLWLCTSAEIPCTVRYFTSNNTLIRYDRYDTILTTDEITCFHVPDEG